MFLVYPTIGRFGKQKLGNPCRKSPWDADTGQEHLSIQGGGYGIAFSPDGHGLASDAGGTVKIYDATPLPEKP